jgi:hypothetical protein
MFVVGDFTRFNLPIELRFQKGFEKYPRLYFGDVITQTGMRSKAETQVPVFISLQVYHKGILKN